MIVFFISKSDSPLQAAAEPFQSGPVSGYSTPGTLPVTPYQQIAASSPLPYQDTTLLKANQQQLVSLLELVKSFLAFEAQGLSEKSDPSIQLPLQTARSDFTILQSEVEVLNRNPGVQSTITLTNLNEMSSNLAYLQKQVRLTGASSSLQIPRFEEGFAADGPIATLQDLKDFVGKLQGEIMRLSASGTNDPVVTTRVNNLTDMKATIQQYIDKITLGTMMELEIPILKKDIDKALPILSDPSQPLPQFLKKAGLPAGLASALPSSVQKDPQTMQQLSTLYNTYAERLINALLGSNQGSTVNQTGFPSIRDLTNAANSLAIRDSGSITDPLAATPMDAGRGRAPSHFDWKQRSKEIENQVKQRGLNPTDFGIGDSGQRSANFSWKGYARMICTRLQATMDPGLPETCGCPPMDWKGWR